MSDYVHPDILVSTEWVADHIDDPRIRIVESNEDVSLYDTGHLENAVKIDWQSELQDALARDYISKENFEKLMSNKGIANDTAVIFYGDKSNWWACYALWAFKLFGHQKCRIMNGGRQKWIAENRSLTTEVAKVPATSYRVGTSQEATIRAFREDVMEHLLANGPLVDVRSPDEYSGKLLHMPDYPQEGALRAGHIPGAKNVPWARATNEDGTFKNANELKALYEVETELTPDDQLIVYCRIGERSSHTWFALTYLLGYPNVRNYDGSWTEWGNTVRVPIER